MALGKTSNVTPHLIDTLCELNSLIESLNSHEVKQAVAELKSKIDAHKDAENSCKAARSAHDETVLKLNQLTSANEKLSAELKRQQDALTADKKENDQKIEKIRSLKAAHDANVADWDKKTGALTEDLKKRSKDISDKEQKANDLHQEAHKVKTEYTQKLADLKKITG